MAGFRVAPVKAGTVKSGTVKSGGKSPAKSHGAGNCGSGAGGFKPGNTCGKGGRKSLADDIRAARAAARDAGGHSSLRDKVRSLRAHRRGRDHAVDDESAAHLRHSLRTGRKAARAKTKADTVKLAHAEVRAAHAAQRARNARDAARKPVHESPRPEPFLAAAYRKHIQDRKDQKVADEKIVRERGAEYEAVKAEHVRLREAMFDLSVSARTRKSREKKYNEHKEKYEAIDAEVGSARSRMEDGSHDRLNARDQERLDQILAQHEAKGPDRYEYARHQADHPDLIAPGPIADRIARYKVGEAKVRALDAIGKHYDAADARLDAIAEKSYKVIDNGISKQNALIEAAVDRSSPALHARVDRIQVRIDRAADLGKRARDERDGLAAKLREDVESVLRVDRPLRVESRDIRPGVVTKAGPLSPPTAGTRAADAEARRFLEKTVARGDGEGLSVEVGEGPAYRAHYREGDPPHIQARSGEAAHTMVHEYGHAIDDQVRVGGRSANESSQEFLKHRVGDETPIDMHERFEAGDPGEMGRKDRFQDAVGSEYNAYYTGKDYGRSASEVTSMGMEHLYMDPVHFARSDPEFAKHILGIMDGSLR